MTDKKDPEAPETAETAETAEDELTEEQLDEASGGVLAPTLNTQFSSINQLVAPADLAGTIDVQSNQMPSNNGIKL